MQIPGSVPFKSTEITAVKILADGTRIELGTIASWHRNPIINAWRQLKLRIKRWFA